MSKFKVKTLYQVSVTDHFPTYNPYNERGSVIVLRLREDILDAIGIYISLRLKYRDTYRYTIKMRKIEDLF